MTAPLSPFLNVLLLSFLLTREGIYNIGSVILGIPNQVVIAKERRLCSQVFNVHSNRDPKMNLSIPSSILSLTQLSPRPPKQPQTAHIARPPHNASDPAPERVINQDIRKPIRHPRSRVHESRAVHVLRLDSRQGGEAHGSPEQGVVLDGIGVRRLVAPQHVQLLLRDLARSDRRVAVLGQILARRRVVVDAVVLLQRARG